MFPSKSLQKSNKIVSKKELTYVLPFLMAVL